MAVNEKKAAVSAAAKQPAKPTTPSSGAGAKPPAKPPSPAPAKENKAVPAQAAHMMAGVQGNLFTLSNIILYALLALVLLLGIIVMILQMQGREEQLKMQRQLKEISDVLIGPKVYQPPKMIANRTKSIFQVNYGNAGAGRYKLTMVSSVFRISREDGVEGKEIVFDYQVQDQDNHPYVTFFLSAPEKDAPQSASYMIQLNLPTGKVQKYQYCYRLYERKFYERVRCL